MNEPPGPPPEGILIEAARKRIGLSIRESARRAGISEGWWRQVARGYQTLSGGAWGPVQAPPETVAKMARVVQLSAAQVENEGRRPDAAEFMLREVPPPPREVPGPLDALPDDEAAAAAPVLAAVRERVRMAAEMNPGRPLRGADVFPREHDPRARLWDRLADAGLEMLPGGFSDDQLAAMLVAELAVRQGGGLAAG